MVEPAVISGLSKAAGAFVGKAFSGSRVRLGGREERRQVYGRFQESTVAVLTYAEEVRLLRKQHRVWVPRRARERLTERTVTLSTEMLQAYMDLRLVANPEPFRAADALLTAVREISDVFNAGNAAYEEKIEAFGAASRAFVEACRLDLWYLPQWWQVWRGSWWRARWMSWRGGAR